MKNYKRESLISICDNLCLTVERYSTKTPSGFCYLSGHCIAEALRLAGFDAQEVTGHLLIADKSGKHIVYGSRKYKGLNVGDYHTVCVLNMDNEKIIVDASIKHNKAYLKKQGIKLNPAIPDYVICAGIDNLYRFIPDEKLSPLSKEFLNKTSPDLIAELINTTISMCDLLNEQ